MSNWKVELGDTSKGIGNPEIWNVLCVHSVNTSFVVHTSLTFTASQGGAKNFEFAVVIIHERRQAVLSVCMDALS